MAAFYILQHVATSSQGMKMSLTIRYTKPQLGLLKQILPDWNLNGLNEITFKYDRDGNILDVFAEVEDDTDQDYAGPALLALAGKARLAALRAQEGPATI